MRRRYLLLLSLLLLFGSAGCRSRLDLSRASTQMNVGVSAARENLWREALFRFNRAVQIDPENAMAHNNLAVAYEGIGEFEKARTEYAEALRLDKSNQYIQRNYSRFVEFYSRNRKREQPLVLKKDETTSDVDSEAAPPSGETPAAATPAASPASAADGTTAPADATPALPADTPPPGEVSPAPIPAEPAPKEPSAPAPTPPAEPTSPPGGVR